MAMMTKRGTISDDNIRYVKSRKMELSSVIQNLATYFKAYISDSFVRIFVLPETTLRIANDPKIEMRNQKYTGP